MFVIGKASDNEIKEMESMGFEVEPVDVLHFDLAMKPGLDVDATNEDRYEEHGDKLVAVFLDCDIVQEMRDIYSQENA